MKLPTLITYRSAEEFRDAGMDFAYRKAGLYAGLLIAMLSFAVAARLTQSGADDGLMIVMLVMGMASLLVAAYSGKTMNFPHSPRLSIEELEIMRDEMGLRQDVFKKTHDSVLHGTFDEHRAIQATDVVLNGLRKNAGGTEIAIASNKQKIRDIAIDLRYREAWRDWWRSTGRILSIASGCIAAVLIAFAVDIVHLNHVLAFLLVLAALGLVWVGSLYPIPSKKDIANTIDYLMSRDLLDKSDAT